MRILVTGVTGFVGNHVINELLKYDYNIIATSIDNPKEARKFQWYSKVNYIECDLNKKGKDFYSYFEKPDIMIHLSWENLPNYSKLFHFEKNLFSNYYFIKNMIENGLRSVSVAGTCFEYGMQSGCLSEELPTNPVSAYGIAKDTLRKFLEKLEEEMKFTFHWIRIFYMYGEGQNPNSLHEQLKRAIKNKDDVFNMSGGEQVRDYLPVEEVAKYIVKISVQNHITGIINCCSNEPKSVREVVEEKIKEEKSNIKLNLGYYPYSQIEPMEFWGNNEKLKKI